MSKWYPSWSYFLIVFLAYVILLSYTAYTYPNLPDKLASGFPKLVIWVPAVISIILPITYGVLAFRLREYLNKARALMLAVFMAVALLGLVGIVYLMSSLD